jgi:hypothetical protein
MLDPWFLDKILVSSAYVSTIDLNQEDRCRYPKVGNFICRQPIRRSNRAMEAVKSRTVLSASIPDLISILGDVNSEVSL